MDRETAILDNADSSSKVDVRKAISARFLMTWEMEQEVLTTVPLVKLMEEHLPRKEVMRQNSNKACRPRYNKTIVMTRSCHQGF